MSRLARVVVPGLPHHVTQRGNGRSRTFFSDDDFRLYLNLLRQNCEDAKVTCQAHVLMPNHVHLILVPQTEDGLSKALSLTHRSYAGQLNARRRKTGHFWREPLAVWLHGWGTSHGGIALPAAEPGAGAAGGAA